MYSNIILDKEDHIAKITLNRPDRLNALDPQTYAEICNAIEDIEADREIRVVIITGSGKAFCAGADLDELQKRLAKASWTFEFLEGCHRATDAIDNCSKPVIAAVNGLTLAGGLEVVEACDIILAADTAKFGDHHAQRGLVPGGGGTQRLIRRINFGKALELLLTGDWLSAEEAGECGLVNKVVPADQLQEAANEMAQKLAKRSPVASKTIKMLAKKGIEIDLATALKMEIAAVTQHFFTDDSREGIQSFVERREPDFKGE